MPKPPPASPSSDIQGVHRDRAPQQDPTVAEKAKNEREARTNDSPGTPGSLDAGEGRGGV